MEKSGTPTTSASWLGQTRPGRAIAVVRNSNRAPAAMVTRFAGIGRGLPAAYVD
jgi:hypothetical protein